MKPAAARCRAHRRGAEWRRKEGPEVGDGDWGAVWDPSNDWNEDKDQGSIRRGWAWPEDGMDDKVTLSKRKAVVPLRLGGICHHSPEDIMCLRGEHMDQPEEFSSLSERVKRIIRTVNRRVTLGRSGIHGFGLIAKRRLQEGEMVVDYRGEAMGARVAEAREKLYKQTGKGCYLFKITESLVVDATLAGTLSRLLNHSCEPNLFAKIVDVEGMSTCSVIMLIARRMIQAGEELTFDYRFDKEGEDRVECFCGAAACRKFMN